MDESDGRRPPGLAPLRPAPTIRDVALKAGVSVATVSRSFTAPGVVRTSTRDLVMRAADAIGYRPNLVARGLITGETANVGIVVPDLANPFFPGILKAAQARARDFQKSVFMADTDEDPDTEFELIKAMLKQVDGFILCSSRMSDERLAEVSQWARMVVLNRRVPGVSGIVADYGDGMRQAVDHLADLGHAVIAYLGGIATFWGDRERLGGLRPAAANRGMNVIYLSSYPGHFDAGLAAVDAVLASGATAVLCYNDLLALGLMAGLAERDVEVPTEISVVGFDDIPIASMCQPKLTTVSIPTADAGRLLVELLLEEGDSGTRAGDVQVIDLPTTLKVRASSARV
jgi:DNA-binding LacI/PurR family transcriptional regulator